MKHQTHKITEVERGARAAPEPDAGNSDTYSAVAIQDVEVVIKAEEHVYPAPSEETSSLSRASTRAESGQIDGVKEGGAREGEGAVAMAGIARVESTGHVLSKSKKTIIALALCVCGTHP